MEILGKIGVGYVPHGFGSLGGHRGQGRPWHHGHRACVSCGVVMDGGLQGAWLIGGFVARRLWALQQRGGERADGVGAGLVRRPADRNPVGFWASRWRVRAAPRAKGSRVYFRAGPRAGACDPTQQCCTDHTRTRIR
jgi:hypothetical protein